MPCVYTAPVTGLYRVAFYGAAGTGNAADGTPDRHLDPAAAASSPRRARRSTRGTSPSARRDPASDVDLPGRTFTYVLAGFTGGNPRPVTMRLFLNTLDGYRYSVDTHGFDPNGFVFYGNRAGFLDADGTTPLNHDVVGTGTNPQTLPSLVGGVHLAPPEYPLSFEPLATETLAALGIPATPVPPTLSAVDFTGRATAHGSYVGQGGTFTLDAGSGGTYEIVISRDGVDFDPGLPGNRALRGLVPAGTFDRDVGRQRQHRRRAPGQGRTTRCGRCCAPASTTRRCSTWRARRWAARASRCSTRRTASARSRAAASTGTELHPRVLRRPHLRHQHRDAGRRRRAGTPLPGVRGRDARARLFADPVAGVDSTGHRARVR